MTDNISLGNIQSVPKRRALARFWEALQVSLQCVEVSTPPSPHFDQALQEHMGSRRQAREDGDIASMYRLVSPWMVQVDTQAPGYHHIDN